MSRRNRINIRRRKDNEHRTAARAAAAEKATKAADKKGTAK
jgi:hypothetical protein